MGSANADYEGPILKPLSPDDPRVTWPLLTVQEAAWGVGVAESTFRNWARGYRMRGRGRRPVVGEAVVTSMPVRGRQASIPFIGIAEGLVLAAFRRTGVPLQRIRPALKALEQEIGLEHALASQRLFSDGAEVLYDYVEAHGDDVARELVVVRSGQAVFAGVLLDYLKLITFSEDGWPTQLRLPHFRQAAVVIDPKRAFGQPLFEHGGARVADVLDRWRAGETFAALANDFGVPANEIEDAARATTPARQAA